MQQPQPTPPPTNYNMAPQGTMPQPVRVQVSPGPKYYAQQPSSTPMGPAGVNPSGQGAPPVGGSQPPRPVHPSSVGSPHQMVVASSGKRQAPASTPAAGSTGSSGQQQAPAAQGRPQQAKKKRRFGDKVIPAEVCDLVPESHAYMDLLAFERKLDTTITRKRLEIQETLKRPMKIKRKLRIYVSHTFYPGRAPEGELDEGQIAQWELRVEGRLMDDVVVASPPPSSGQPKPPAAAPAPPPTADPTKQQKRKFSSFFKSLVIELDKDIYGPDNHLVEWHRTPNTNETDGFQVKRPGDRSVKCTILLLLDHMPMKFKLDPRLARLLGLHTETRPRIIEALWQYVKTHKLQDAHERDHINCDKYLEQTFQCQRMRFMEIPQRLNGLLHPPDPIVIHHVITCNPDGLEPKKTVCYDIDVEVDDPMKMQMTQFLASLQNQNDIITCDNRIYETVEQIQQLKMQREFFLAFAQNPKEFIEKWIASQSRDLKVMTDVSAEPEEERQSNYYGNAWVSEAVGRYFYGKVQQKRAELEQTLGVRNL